MCSIQRQVVILGRPGIAELARRKLNHRVAVPMPGAEVHLGSGRATDEVEGMRN